MTREELIDSLNGDAYRLGHITNGNAAFEGSRGLMLAVKWAEAYTRNFPAERRWAIPRDRAVAAWLRRARAAIILYRIV